MLNIKKSTFIILILVSILAGMLAVCAYINVDLSQLSLLSEGSVIVSKSEYDNIKSMGEKYSKLSVLRNYIEDNYYEDVDEESLENGMCFGLVAGLCDTYSSYYTKEEFDQLLITSTGEYSGVGLTISPGDLYVEVVSVNEDGPAYAAGFKTGDLIIAVDDKEYYADQYSDVAEALRGTAGTDVKVTYLRGDEVLDVVITRAEIIAKSVKYEMLDGNVAYIRISQFLEATATDFKAALEDLTAQGAESLVVDLRNNGGGIVDSAIEIADELMEEETVVYCEDGKGQRSYYTTTAGRTDLEYVILVDGGSASASEILCAGVKDNKEGTIVGTQTYGKGVIQETNRLYDGSGIKLTVMQYFSPNGTAIHGEGITPDYIVEAAESESTETESSDPQLEKALELLKK